MTFIADRMLGKLARWLRMLGYDTQYVQQFDAELLQQAYQTQRIVLTRNTTLFASLPPDAGVFITSDHVAAQAQQILDSFHLTPDETRVLSRCLTCNTVLERVEKTIVEGEVPDFIFHTQQEFARCPHCRKLYWKGSHHQKVLKQLGQLTLQEKR